MGTWCFGERLGEVRKGKEGLIFPNIERTMEGPSTFS
jgi:hypothetical protein